jgi:DNA helicase-2/ATP-dependent DNA helicase PcrA
VDLERDLNPQQREAVLNDRGPLLVLAGAGSGKTRVITYRIAHLIHSGVHPSSILAVTFTNKAAGEMRSRAESLLQRQATGIWIGTFHSVCARLLRIYGSRVNLSPRFVIYDDSDQLVLLRRVQTDLGIPEHLLAAKEVRWRIDQAKNAGVGPDRFEGGDAVRDLVARIYPEYERRLEAADAADFGNLLMKAVQLLGEDRELVDLLAQRFEHVLVDEFQDTNAVQYRLVQQLSQAHRNLCVVGDDDQAIYGWRGANIRNILGFEKDHPETKVVKLEQNYRSTQVILDAAGAVIDGNVGRKAKQLWTDQRGGALIEISACEDERAEAQTALSVIQRLRLAEERVFGDFAIFYRTHAQSRVIEEALRGAIPPVPYAVVGGIRFYDRAEIKDLLAYLRLLANPADDVSLQRIINVPTRGIGAGTMEKVAAVARQAELPLLETVRRCAAGEADAGGSLKSAARNRLERFAALMEELAEEAPKLDLSGLAERVLEHTGYVERLAIDGSPEAQSRVENLMELLASIQDYENRTEDPSLIGFLEQVSLASDVDGYSEKEGQVTLMTVHSAKGLEFPVVLIVGLEQGIFPHARSLSSPDQMEEERRLAYVAITRARQRLFLSFARSRWTYSQVQANPPSVFLRALPSELLAPGSRVHRRSSPGTDHQRGEPWRRHREQQRSTTGRSSRDSSQQVWIDRSYDQSGPGDHSTTGDETGGFRVGMAVRHTKFGTGEVRMITGAPPNQNLTIFFHRVGPKTIRSQFVKPI